MFVALPQLQSFCHITLASQTTTDRRRIMTWQYCCSVQLKTEKRGLSNADRKMQIGYDQSAVTLNISSNWHTITCTHFSFASQWHKIQSINSREFPDTFQLLRIPESSFYFCLLLVACFFIF